MEVALSVLSVLCGEIIVISGIDLLGFRGVKIVRKCEFKPIEVLKTAVLEKFKKQFL